MDHWTGALFLERTLVVMAAGFNSLHFLRELRRLSRREAAGPRRRRGTGAALAAMAVINLALAAGALHPLAAGRFAWVGRSPELEAVAVGLSLTAALFITALIRRERK